MAEIEDPYAVLAEVEARPKPGRRKKQQPEIENPLEEVNPAQARRISARGKSVYHGDLLQVTFRISAEYKEAIERIAENEGLTKEEAKRWVVGTGLQAYAHGRRPEVEARVVKTRAKLPEVNL